MLYEMFVCVSTFDDDKNHHLLGRIVWPFKVPLAVICTGRCSSWYILWWYILYTSSRNTGQIAEVFVNAVQSSQQQKTVAHTKQSAPLKDDGSPRPPLQAARKLLPTPSSTPQLPARLMKPEIFEKQSYGMIQPMLPLNHVAVEDFGDAQHFASGMSIVDLEDTSNFCFQTPVGRSSVLSTLIGIVTMECGHVNACI